MFGTAYFRSPLVPTFVVVTWLIVIASGFAVFHRYESTPGINGDPLAAWPKENPLPLESDRLTLVLAIHPRCPCTRATARAIEELLATRADRAQLNVLVFKPANAREDWPSTSTVQSLIALPGARCWIDEGGVLAARFGASTSGQLLAFDSRSRLLFSGGITPMRGQVGPNAGYAALAALLDGKAAVQNSAPVFGCSILSAPSGLGGES